MYTLPITKKLKTFIKTAFLKFHKINQARLIFLVLSHKIVALVLNFSLTNSSFNVFVNKTKMSQIQSTNSGHLNTWKNENP